MKIASQVRIEMGEGPAVNGNTKVFVDGVEQTAIRRAVLDIEAGNVAQLRLEHFVEVVVEGEAEVEHVHVCPECKAELMKALEPGTAAMVDVTDIHTRWVRKQPIAVKDEEGNIIE